MRKGNVRTSKSELNTQKFPLSGTRADLGVRFDCDINGEISDRIECATSTDSSENTANFRVHKTLSEQWRRVE